LLTLTGPAGTGKTRLALALATALRDEFADGVHFVDLAPIREPSLVASAIAQTLGVGDAGDQPLRETLLLNVQPRQLMLVLDNFEQVVAASPLVAELLSASPGLKILVTSREPLHLSWEHEWPVPPLALPPPGEADHASIAQSAAVTLFSERARSVKPDFMLTPVNCGLVKDICIRLDGLPLAIELAAATTKLLPLAAIQARLNQRLLLLTSGPRDAPVRHQTLRAAVAWSYGLLPSDEQAMFRALSVFVGGFTLEAAKAIVGDADASTTSVLERVRSLIDKSLVLPATSATADTVPRFGMLETIREFGLEQLSVSGEFEPVQEYHARFFIQLAGEGGLEMGDAELGPWLDRLEAEHDNLRAVLQWSETAPESGDTGPLLASALMMFWNVRGYFGEGREWYERVLVTNRCASRSPVARARALWSAAFVAWRQGDYAAAGRLSGEAVTLGQHLAEGRDVVMALAVRGLVASHQSQYAEAHAMLDRGHALATEIDHTIARAWMLAISGILAYLEGNYVLARTSSEESLRMLQQRRSAPTGAAMNLDNLGSIARRLGEYPLAQSLHQQSLILSQQVGDRAAAAQSLANLGHVARALGDTDTARARYAEALEIRREIGDRRGIALTAGNLGTLAHIAGDYDLAQDWLEESLVAAHAVGDKRVLAGALDHLADLALGRANLAAAAAGYYDSLEVSEGLQDRWAVARSLEGCAAVLLAEGRPESALEMCTLADALLDALGVRRAPADQVAHERLLAATGARHGVARPTRGGRPQIPSVSLAVARARALLRSDSAAKEAQPDDLLSPREREVAGLVAHGLTNREIAAELVIAERTADTHVSNVLGKLGLKTRSQIAVWVAEHDRLRAQSV
jgi:predicted ATPase/DNA-binding CsgD family transcriptional regulator